MNLFNSYVVQVHKSFSEALILASINPKYDKRLFIELRAQYMKTTSSEHVVYINCSECQNKNQFVYTTCSELVVFIRYLSRFTDRFANETMHAYIGNNRPGK